MTLFISFIGAGAVAVALIMAGVSDRLLYPVALASFVMFAWLLHGIKAEA